MKSAFFLTARLGSTRLPRKHLLEVSGMSLLQVLAGRVARAFDDRLRAGQSVLAIVTSDEPENREFERFTADGVKVFYGAKENIPLRHLEAARHFGVDVVVAVDGDDILCSTDAMRVVHEGLVRGDPYASTSGLPLGMNAFGYRRDFLAASVAGNEHKTLETGWGYIFDRSRLTTYSIELPMKLPQSLRFTLDYSEDYEFFKAIVEHFGPAIMTATDNDIVSYVVNQGLQKLTDPVSQKYWENFRSVQAQEMRHG